MTKSRFQERIVSLYLRLNGYFQTGNIAHSKENGKNGTEIDVLAVRFPHHNQSEREVGFSVSLSIPTNTIDVIISEVKNKKVEFNVSLKTGHLNADSNWSQILRWIGLFEIAELPNLINQLKSIVDKDGLKEKGSFKVVSHKKSFGQITIRPIIFSFETMHKKGDKQIWINADDMIEYIWECLCPAVIRKDCSTQYPLSNWGAEFEDLVDYFKSRNKKKLGKPTLTEIYTKFNIK